ncbi:major facilitator superfamily domain-containing protein [Xylariales sp. PMI_506]|nr:major facilitator superfamily domain-containing protein [Xylariales sp. PMI_506]
MAKQDGKDGILSDLKQESDSSILHSAVTILGRSDSTSETQTVADANTDADADADGDGHGLDGTTNSPDTRKGTPPVAVLSKVLGWLNWMPQRCRYDPKNPPKFTLAMNILMAFATTFTVANLYYPQPILNRFAETFNVSNERAASVATLSQAGYAAGLLFICPLADYVPRRPFILFLIVATATVWLGLCLTNNFEVFSALSFICGAGTVTPQLMLPLVGDLAPVERRASAISLTVSGLTLGMLIARVLSGIVANYTDWRNIYWIALGLQYLSFGTLFLFLPDYPVKNTGLRYFHLLWDIAVLVATEPLLLQACLITFIVSATFTSFWTTLTFLLSSPLYNYSSLEIGVFALIGVVMICLGPVFSRVIIDHFIALFSVGVGLAIELIGITIGTFIGRFSIGGPIIQAVCQDAGANFVNVASRANVYGLDPKKRNRINTAYMVFAFSGQLTGTAVGNRLYAQGGWIWSGSCNIALVVAGIIVCLARGPRETGWVGWTGGWKLRKDKPAQSEKPTEAAEKVVIEDNTTTEREVV